MGERTVFLADLHLRPDGREPSLPALSRFLDPSLAETARLVLLGDMFHFWWERRGRVIGEFRQALDLFARVARRGVAIHHVIGNRDFLVGAGGDYPGFIGPRGGRSVLEDYGIRPEGRSFLFEQDGERVFCTHGDDFCTRDYRFRALRWLLQGPAGRTWFRVFPTWGFAPMVRAAQAKPLRPRKRKGNALLRQGLQDDAWQRAAALHRADRVVCGHIHRGSSREAEVDGRRACLTVVPAWREGGGYAVLEGRQMNWMDASER